MLKIRVHALIAGGVTLLQWSPPSIVTWMLPSSVPAQITARSRGEGESAVIAPSGATVTSLAYFPALGGTSQVWRVRSGLIRLQLWPRSMVFHTTFEV